MPRPSCFRAVGALFHGESRQGFVRDSPMARAALEACQAQAAGQVQAGCTRAQLAPAQQRAKTTTVAAVDAPSTTGPAGARNGTAP